MKETYMFPLRNERGFKVLNVDDYIHMIHTIIETQEELAGEYPDKIVMVVYGAGDV